MEKSDYGIIYYSAIPDNGRIELQVALHESGLINKINLVSTPAHDVRLPISKDTFDAALNKAEDRFKLFLQSEFVQE